MILNIELIPIEICKWNCEYCIFPTINNPRETKIDIINKHLPYIKNIIDILISNKIDVQLYMQGGEVGELSKFIIQTIMRIISLPITISTNGLFMKKEYHKDPEIKKYIKQIFWHVSPDCDLKQIDDFNSDINIIRGVVHPDKIKLNQFISYTNLNIKYSKVENNLLTKSSVNEKIIKKCRNFNNDIIIDLVNENICLCIRNFKTITIPLTKENLIYTLKSFPKNIYNLLSIENSSCYSCSRLCIDKAHKNVIQNKVKLMKIDFEKLI